MLGALWKIRNISIMAWGALKDMVEHEMKRFR